MNNCKDCKYWDSRDGGLNGICDGIADEIESPDAYIANHDWSETYLVTVAEFGCALFEAKEQP